MLTKKGEEKIWPKDIDDKKSIKGLLIVLAIIAAVFIVSLIRNGGF